MVIQGERLKCGRGGCEELGKWKNETPGVQKTVGRQQEAACAGGTHALSIVASLDGKYSEL